MHLIGIGAYEQAAAGLGVVGIRCPPGTMKAGQFVWGGGSAYPGGPRLPNPTDAQLRAQCGWLRRQQPYRGAMRGLGATATFNGVQYTDARCGPGTITQANNPSAWCVPGDLTCGPGFSTMFGHCVLIPTCVQGQFMDPVTGKCVQQIQTSPDCDSGYYKDTSGKCVPFTQRRGTQQYHPGGNVQAAPPPRDSTPHNIKNVHGNVKQGPLPGDNKKITAPLIREVRSSNWNKQRTRAAPHLPACLDDAQVKYLAGCLPATKPAAGSVCYWLKRDSNFAMRLATASHCPIETTEKPITCAKTCPPGTTQMPDCSCAPGPDITEAAPPPPGEKKTNYLLIGGIAAGVLVVGGGLAWYVMKKKG